MHARVHSAPKLQANFQQCSKVGPKPDEASDDEVDDSTLCPICLANEDGADGSGVGKRAQCFACGQLYCGDCNTADALGRFSECPVCRAPFVVPDQANFQRLWKLVHDRPPGRCTGPLLNPFPPPRSPV